MSSQSLRLPNDPSSGDTPDNGLSITPENLEAQGRRNATTIDILSDNVLLEIFDRYRKGDDQYLQSPFHVWKWHLLVHVCRRWRQIIFASPRRLDLQLLCTYGTSYRKIMGIWPTIPITILFLGIGGRSDDDFISVLEHPDRVSRINIFVPGSDLGKIAALIQEPFPLLTHLSVTSLFGSNSALPGGFLGGSAPSLQQLDLCDVVYPALPMLLLSANNLVNLRLQARNMVPPTSYISPEAMVSHVAASPKLETLYIDFDAPPSLPDIILSTPLTRAILPALRNFSFSGKCKYLEDFISQIDAPQLNSIFVYYYQSGHNFDVPQLSKLVNRSECLKRSLSRHCKIMADYDLDIVTFCVGRTTSERWDPKPGISVSLGIGIEDQISHLTNILGFMSPILSDVVHCTIEPVLWISYPEPWSDPLAPHDYAWLQLLRRLSSVQTLFVADNSADLISHALVYLHGEMVTEVLPALKLLCLEGDLPTPSVHNFLAVRRESGHPVTFVNTKEEFDEKLKSYP